MTERLFSFQTNLETMMAAFFFLRRFRVHDYWARDNRCIIFLRDVTNGSRVTCSADICTASYGFLKIFTLDFSFLYGFM